MVRGGPNDEAQGGYLSHDDLGENLGVWIGRGGVLTRLDVRRELYVIPQVSPSALVLIGESIEPSSYRIHLHREQGRRYEPRPLLLCVPPPPLFGPMTDVRPSHQVFNLVSPNPPTLMVSITHE